MKTESAVPSTPTTAPAPTWQGVWAIGDRCDARVASNPIQGETKRLLIASDGRCAVQANQDEPQPLALADAARWLAGEMAQNTGIDCDEDYGPAFGLFLEALADAVAPDLRIDGEHVVLSGALAKRVQESAKRNGQTSEDVCIQALAEFAEREEKAVAK